MLCIKYNQIDGLEMSEIVRACCKYAEMLNMLGILFRKLESENAICRCTYV
jgi:hypothetical protein